MQPFAIGLRSIAHSIAKQYYILHTYKHTHIHVCIHVLKYFRVVTLQNDISFEWSRRAQCSEFQEIPQGFMFLHLTKGQTAATSKQNTSPSSSPYPPTSPPPGWVWDSPSLRLTASKAKPNIHLVPAFFMLFLFLFLHRRRRRSARLVYYALLHARFSVLPFIVLPPLNCCEIFCNN